MHILIFLHFCCSFKNLSGTEVFDNASGSETKSTRTLRSLIILALLGNDSARRGIIVCCDDSLICLEQLPLFCLFFSLSFVHAKSEI